MGDSHAEHLFFGLANAYPEKNIVYYTRSGAPVHGDPKFADVLATVIESKSLKKVIVSAQWTFPMIWFPGDGQLRNEILSTLRDIVDSGKEVYLTDDVPAFPFDPARCAGVRALSMGGRAECAVERATVDAATAPYLAVLHDVARSDERIKLIETLRYFCNDRSCDMANDDGLLYRDRHHLSIIGSTYVGRMIRRDYRYLD